jgi:hypothetical protein
MKAKHTPAPWNIHPQYTEIEPLAVIRDDGTGFVAWTTYVARGTKIIAEVRGYSTHAGYENVDNQFEVEANARLIASAPELLEALKGVFNIRPSDTCGCELGELELQAWDKVRQAIAKAEGA